MKKLQGHNALDPIEYLEHRLKKVVVKNYRGMRPGVYLPNSLF
jgi:hypothetical protein